MRHAAVDGPGRPYATVDGLDGPMLLLTGLGPY